MISWFINFIKKDFVQELTVFTAYLMLVSIGWFMVSIFFVGFVTAIFETVHLPITLPVKLGVLLIDTVVFIAWCWTNWVDRYDSYRK